MALEHLRTRELLGIRASCRMENTVKLLRLRSLALSRHIELSPVHHEEVTALSLDPVEHRYLLSGEYTVCSRET